MSATIPCTPCCSSVQVVDIPGAQGADGANGTNGLNAFSITTASFVVPAVNSNVTVSVDDSQWMAIGQIVVADGPATFQVVSKANTTSAVLKFLGYSGDVSPGATVTSPATISPAGVLSSLTSPLTVYASGTPYSLTNTPAKLDFGTTDPVLTISSAGTYMILARCRIDYNGLGVTDGRTVTIKLRRTNNTAGDLTNGSDAFKPAVNTTGTGTAGLLDLQPVVYTTVNNDDSLELWGSVDVVDNANNLRAVEASIVAVKLF